MAGQKRLCYIEDVITMVGRGIVIKPDKIREGQVRPGDWIEIRSADGSNHVAKVRTIELIRFPPGKAPVADANHAGGLLITSLTREEVHADDEVWTVTHPPAKEPPDVFFRTAKPTRPLPEVLTPGFWRRLVGGK